MLLDRKMGGFMPDNRKKEESYIQEDFYCEMCSRTTKEETELDEKLNKYLCEGCRKEQERKRK